MYVEVEIYSNLNLNLNLNLNIGMFVIQYIAELNSIIQLLHTSVFNSRNNVLYFCL